MERGFSGRSEIQTGIHPFLGSPGGSKCRERAWAIHVRFPTQGLVHAGRIQNQFHLRSGALGSGQGKSGKPLAGGKVFDCFGWFWALWVDGRSRRERGPPTELEGLCARKLRMFLRILEKTNLGFLTAEWSPGDSFSGWPRVSESDVVSTGVSGVP